MRNQKKKKIGLAMILTAAILSNLMPCALAENEENFSADGDAAVDTPIIEQQDDENNAEEIENIAPVVLQSSMGEMNVEKLYADESCIKIFFNTDSIGNFDDLNGISVRDESGDTVAISSAKSENGVLCLFPETKLTLDEVYEINVDAGVKSDINEVTKDYTEKFIVSLVYSENFDGKTRGQGYYYGNIGVTDVFEGKLWLWGYGTVGIGYDGISELENYTLSFDYTPYLQTNASGWLRNAPYTWIRYNASGKTASATGKKDGHGWQMVTDHLNGWEQTGNVSTAWKMPYAEASREMNGGLISKIDVSKPAEASKLTFSKTGKDCSVYKDGNLVVDYSPADENGTDVTKGYFVITSNESNVCQSIDNVRITVCSEAPEKEYFNVESSYADVYGIKVVFDKDISVLDINADDIKLSKSMENVKIKALNKEKNEIFITPENGLEKDVNYTLYIKKGLGSKWNSLEKNYISSFKIKDYFSDDFNGYSSRGEGMQNVSNINFVGCRDGKIWMYYGSGFNFAVPGLEELEDYTLSFEYTAYNNNKKSANGTAPQTWVGYNMDSGANPTQKNKGYGFTMYNTSLNFWENGGGAGSVNWKMPYCNADFEFYQLGEEGGVVNGIKSISPVDGSEEIPSLLTFSKHGSEMRVYKDGELVTDYKPNHISPEKTKGYFGFSTPADRPTVNFFDNLNVTVMESVNNGSVSVAGASCFDGENNVVTENNISAANKICGIARLTNFSEEEKDVTVAAVAYGKDGELLRVQILDIDKIDAKDMVDVEYSLESLQNAETVKLLVWDNEENYKLYQPAYKVV